ncbi:MAG: uroporphyrinogen-III synthase [Planctomycetes bacterium]|nr:uroporphyrinogen-III synthase [Planctomycetota bacterium]MBI3844595.1 uroporphyrinogen-III synthase [Planctomycetota bacterium]
MTARGAAEALKLRVLIARAEGDAAALAEILRRRGYRPETFAAIRTRGPRRRRGLERAASRAAQFTDVVFASRASVHAFVAALARSGQKVQDLGHARIIAVGPATARAARAAGFRKALRPNDASGRGVLAMFASQRDLGDRRVLLPAAANGRREIADGLRSLGARVTRVEAYRTVLASRMPEGIRRALDAGEFGAAVFASPSGVSAFVKCAGPRRMRRLVATLATVAIGATTAAALSNAGFERVFRSRLTNPAALGATVARAVARARSRRVARDLRSIDKPGDDS